MMSKTINTKQLLLPMNYEGTTEATHFNLKLTLVNIDESLEELGLYIRKRPVQSYEKLEHALMYILNKVDEHCRTEPFLTKLMYLMDFDYYELYEEGLMGLEYIKKEDEPFYKEFKQFVDHLHSKGFIEITNKYINSISKLRYIYKNFTSLSRKEINHIDSILKKHGYKTEKELFSFIRNDIPLLVCKDGETLDYETVFYRDEYNSVRRY